MDNPAGVKKLLRKELREKCKNIPRDWKIVADSAINNRLMDDKLWSGINKIALFAGDASEPDLSPFMAWAQSNGKSIFLPRYRHDTGDYELAEIKNPADDLVSGKYGILEPASHLRAADSGETAREIAWIIPGVGFDASGVRLGRGKGFYDRLLAGVTGRIMGIFYQFQYMENIPDEEHDRKMSCAVTEENFYIFDKMKS